MSDGSEGDARGRDAAERRVQTLVAAARAVADGASNLGRRARQALVESTGLHPNGVELALAECLETAPSAEEVGALVASGRPCPRIHLILPSNVFIAAHRSLALALAASADVRVRPSRREPHFARFLAEAAPGLFTIVDDVRPEAGDEVWAYGAEASLTAIRSELPRGVALHAHGPGTGVAVVEASHVSVETAAALVADIVPFDQRGCLSPRAALVVGSRADAAHFAEFVAQALTVAARHIPLGRLSGAELADARGFRDARRYAGSCFEAGASTVAVDDGRLAFAPSGRQLVVTACADPLALLEPRAAELTAFGVAGAGGLVLSLEKAFPGARRSVLGRMQRPPFDGPADRRAVVG